MRRLPRVRDGLLLATLLLPAACALPKAPPAGCPAGQQAATRLEIFFGLARPDGSLVSETEWQAFHEEALLPAFPDGMTLLSGQGHWRDDEGRLWREPSKLVVVLTPGAGDLEQRVAALARDYKARFQQQAVLSVESAACVAFR